MLIYLLIIINIRLLLSFGTINTSYDCNNFTIDYNFTEYLINYENKYLNNQLTNDLSIYLPFICLCKSSILLNESIESYLIYNITKILSSTYVNESISCLSNFLTSQTFNKFNQIDLIDQYIDSVVNTNDHIDVNLLNDLSLYKSIYHSIKQSDDLANSINSIDNLTIYPFIYKSINNSIYSSILTSNYPDFSEIYPLYLTIAKDNHVNFLNNKPFPYIVIEELYPLDFLLSLSREFPEHVLGDPISVGWGDLTLNVMNRKLSCSHEYFMGPKIRHMISHFKSQIFIEFLEKLTGIEGLIPDPKYYGSGLHQTRSGGHLSIHTDFSYHKNGLMWRRVNVFLYLNENWDYRWGGQLELWDESLTYRHVSIDPRLGRLVIFKTSDRSFHGHPDPLATPYNITRKSIAMYYYTIDNNEPNELTARPTKYMSRPNENLVIDG